MTSTGALRDQIAALLCEALQLEVPSADTDLFETGILDSLAFVELLLALERRFGMATPLEDLEVDNFKSISRIADYVARRQPVAADRVATA